MKLSAAVLCALVAVQAAVLLASVSSAEAGELKVGYYGKKCRGVENVIKWHVIRAIRANRRTGAALVRLIFHDCFVRVSTHARPCARSSSSLSRYCYVVNGVH
jgi:peroxidase